jgi:hypothetical protein
VSPGVSSSCLICIVNVKKVSNMLLDDVIDENVNLSMIEC